MKRLPMILLSLLAVSIVIIINCSSDTKSSKSKDESVLTILHPVYDMDWSNMRGGGNNVRWLSLWWASPMYFDKNGKIQPFVFSSWEANEDNTVWTLKIDESAVFSDGSKITSSDVKGTWDLMTHPATKHQRIGLFLNGVKGFTEVSTGKEKEMSGIKVIDPSTVQVTLDSPDPIFASKLATALISPVKISTVIGADGEEKKEWWHPKNDVICSGPFMPQSMDLDAGVLIFVQNPKFFKGKPKIDKVVIKSVEDAQTATLMLQKGEADAHTELSTPTIIDDLGEDFMSGNMLAKGHQFWFDASKEPTNDINVRKALTMAVDVNEVFKAAFPKGPNEAATQILNKVDGVDNSLKTYSYDPEAAKAALAKSKYKSAKKLPKIMFVGISNPAHEAAAQYIAEQWRQNLGIEGTEMKPGIDSYSGPDQKNVQIFRDDVGTRVPDAVSYLMGSIHSASGNAKRKMGGYKNSKIDTLLETASKKGVNDPDRINLAQEAQKIFINEYMFIPYHYNTMSKWAMPWVKNFEKNDDWQICEPWNVEIEKQL